MFKKYVARPWRRRDTRFIQCMSISQVNIHVRTSRKKCFCFLLLHGQATHFLTPLEPFYFWKSTVDIINSGLETEQPIRVHFYDLTWWTWCLAPPLQFPDTRSSIEIRYGDFFGYLKTAFYSGGLGVCCRHCSLGQNIICTMSMEFQSPGYNPHWWGGVGTLVLVGSWYILQCT